MAIIIALIAVILIIVSAISAWNKQLEANRQAQAETAKQNIESINANQELAESVSDLTEEYKKYLENKKVEYIDLFETLKPYSTLSNNKVTKDSVHPTPFGHGLIAQTIIDYLFK